MRRPLAISAALHVLVAALALVGLTLGAEPAAEDAGIAIEIVAVPGPKAAKSPPAEAAPVPKREAAAVDPATRTQQATRAEPTPAAPAPPAAAPPPAPKPSEPKPAEPKAEAPPPEPKPEPPKPAPPPPDPKPAEPKRAEPRPPEPAPAEKAATVKPPPPPEKKPPPAPKPPAPKPILEKTPEPPPARPAKAEDPPAKVAAKSDSVTPAKVTKSPQPKAETAPETKDALDEVFEKTIENQAKRVQAPETRPGKGKAQEASAQADAGMLGRLIRDQVTPCWSIPLGVRDVALLKPKLDIQFAPDGTVRSVRPVDEARMAGDPAFRAVAEAAVRAVQTCSPLRMPAESYEQWRHVIFNFDPSAAA